MGAKSFCLMLVAGCLLETSAALTWADESSLPLKAGIIGMDAHALPWTKIINAQQAAGELADMVVVAGYPGGSPDIPQSMQLLDKSVAPVAELGVEIVDSIDEQLGELVGCDQYAPCNLEPHHRDFFWYGIHGVEPLLTIMGPGCVSVTRIHTEGTDLAVGVWKDGQIGTFRGIRQGQRGYGSTVFGTKGIVPGGGFDGYEPLIVEIIKFFKTGKPPISEQETLEIFAFMEAADESKRRGGCPVTLESVMKKAHQAADIK